MAGVLINSINPYIYGKIIDSITQGKLEVLTKCLLVYFINMILIQIFGIVESFVGQIAVTLIENDVKSKLLDKIIFFKCSSLDEYMEGEWVNY